MATSEGFYRPGDFYLHCEICGFKKRRSECRKRWDGAVVCMEDYEPKNPLLEPPLPRPERAGVLDARQTAPVYVDPGGYVEVEYVEPDWVI